MFRFPSAFCTYASFPCFGASTRAVGNGELKICSRLNGDCAKLAAATSETATVTKKRRSTADSLNRSNVAHDIRRPRREQALAGPIVG